MVKINDVKFSDVYVTPDKKAFIPDGKTRNGLALLPAEDFEEFYKQLQEAWDGHNPSYSLLYEGVFYRIERTMSIYGPQYCGRKMPKQVPPLSTLGFDQNLVTYLKSLSNASGLILWAGRPDKVRRHRFPLCSRNICSQKAVLPIRLKTLAKCRWTAFIRRAAAVWACASKIFRLTGTGEQA